MEIKTCEEYVLNELNIVLNELDNALNELDNALKEKNELNNQNKKLERLIKTLVKKGDFTKIDNTETFATYLYSWKEEDKVIIEELKKYKDEEEKENE